VGDQPSGEAEDFFADIQAAQEQFESAFDDPALDNPVAAAKSFGEAVEVMRSIDPPTEIADDWAVFIDSLETMAAAMG
jgi:hypothetical protein